MNNVIELSNGRSNADYEERRRYPNFTIQKEGPLIYAIQNKFSGQYYIGKTPGSAMHRWYAHIYNSENLNNKFARAIRESDVTHWTFTVLELVEFPVGKVKKEFFDEFVRYRETEWILKYNSINNGYNIGVSNKEYEIWRTVLNAH